MPKEKSIVSHIFSYGGVTAVTTLAMFSLHLVAARYLGAEDFGRLSFAIAFVALFAFLLDPGLYYYLIREVSRDKSVAYRYLSHSLTWKLLCAIPFLLIVLAVVNFIHDSTVTIQIVVLMSIAQILISTKDAFRPILLAHELFNLDALSLSIERISLLVATIFVLVNGYSLLSIGWVFIIVRSFDLLIIAFIVRYKICKVSVGKDLCFMKSIVVDAIPIGAFYMTLTFYNYIDTVMLSKLASDQQVGWYSASYKLYEGPILIPSIIATVFLPRLSRLFVQQKDQFLSLFEQGLKYIVLIAILVSSNGILLSSLLVTLSFGEQYNEAILSLDILIAGMVFVFTITFLQTVMISVDRQKLIFYITLFGLSLNVVANLILIPFYGYIGAAIATISVEGLVCITLCMTVHRYLAKPNWWQTVVKPIVISGVFLLLIVLFTSGLSVIIQLLVLNAGLLLLFILTGALERDVFLAVTAHFRRHDNPD